MMKALTRLCLLTVLIALYSAASMAQETSASSWVKVSPEGETFTVMMPQAPAVSDRKYQHGQLKADGKLYSVESDNISYRLWSFKDQDLTGSALTHTDSYLDACADLVWEALLKPERERIEKSRGKFTSMQYRRELPPPVSAPGREYSITLDTAQGVVHFYIDAPNRIYVLVVMSPAYNPELFDQFLKSFTLTNRPSATLDTDPMLMPPGSRPIPYGDPRNTGGGAGAGASSAAGRVGEDYNRVFSPREVTQKARLLSKPEPQYTEAARKYAVSGTVVLRAIFSAKGQVEKIRVMSKLPHGLTERSIEAARGIKFQPAIKDGRPVSQYIQIEYNYNLY